MTVKEILAKKPYGKKYEFYYINMEKINPDKLHQLNPYPAILLEDCSDDNKKCFKVLVSKEAQAHAINPRKVNTCFDCLRYPTCDKLTDELREEHEKDILRKMKIDWEN
jgi:hypothetical protein